MVYVRPVTKTVALHASFTATTAFVQRTRQSERKPAASLRRGVHHAHGRCRSALWLQSRSESSTRQGRGPFQESVPSNRAEQVYNVAC